jgi:hypothetical protein
MSSSRFVFPLLFTAFALVAGCATETADENTGSDQNELRLSAEYLGKIVNGQTRIAHYDTPPEFRAFGFEAKGGDKITVEVKSPNGNAMGYITDGQLEVLAQNDDASAGTHDSKVTYEVPAGLPLRQYRAAFRDLQLSSATLQVKLSMRGGGPTACTYNGQTYAAGDEFAASNACNTCRCAPTGAVSCTSLQCTCDPAQEPWRTYLGTPEQCVTLSYECPAGQYPFSNPGCGCGCERPH